MIKQKVCFFSLLFLVFSCSENRGGLDQSCLQSLRVGKFESCGLFFKTTIDRNDSIQIEKVIGQEGLIKSNIEWLSDSIYVLYDFAYYNFDGGDIKEREPLTVRIINCDENGYNCLVKDRIGYEYEACFSWMK